MNKILKALPDAARDNLKKKDQPEWTSPMLATLTHERFSRDNWIFERKLDGERCLVFKKGKEVRLMSRNKKELNDQYPEISEAFKQQKQDFVVDGEIVAFEGEVTSFSKLQNRMHREKADESVKVYFYVFDILHFDGYDLTGMELRHRKSVLTEALDLSDQKVIRFTGHRIKEGEKYLKEACGKNWEGLIAKDATSKYVHSRSKKWLKFKCENQQELIICGYTDPGGEREYFGALIVGFYEDDKLKSAGKVGTGYDDETLEMLYNKMKPLERKTPPFDEEVEDKPDIHWLTPKLVGQFQFTEWTGDHKLRHPSYIGLRDDKKAKDVNKEVPSS